jgi:hypothetical protein
VEGNLPVFVTLREHFNILLNKLKHAYDSIQGVPKFVRGCGHEYTFLLASLLLGLKQSYVGNISKRHEDTSHLVNDCNFLEYLKVFLSFNGLEYFWIIPFNEII